MNLPHIFLGTLREHYILLFGLAGGFGLVVGFLGAWLGARLGTRAALRQTASETNQNLASRAEVLALNDELQGLLVEVERIAEGQRYVAKVLTERVMPPALSGIPHPRREPGEITPH